MAIQQYDSVLTVTPGDRGTSTTNSTKGVNGMTKYRLATAALVALVALAFSSTAFAHTATPQSGQNTASVSSLGYCGPPFTSKTMMIAWLQANPAWAAKAEAYLKKYASYYHIRSDQTIIAWLQMPNVKFKKAPAGYMLMPGPNGQPANTGCTGDGTPVGTTVHLNASGVWGLWWCNNAAGAGSNCVMIAKYYCRNWVHGPTVFHTPTPVIPKKPQPKPKKCTDTKATNYGKVGKCTYPPPTSGTCTVTINGNVSGNVNVCNTYVITITCGNYSQTFTGASATDVSGQAQAWQQANCTSSPAPPTPQTCPSGTTGTWPICNPIPPPPTPVCTDRTADNYNSPGACVKTAPKLSNPTTTQEAYANGEVITNRCVTVTGKSGDTIIVPVGASYGSMSPSSITITSHGVDTVCSAYTAPNVPANDPVIGKNDVIKWNAHDSTNNTDAVEVDSNAFPILAPPNGGNRP